MLYGSIIDLYVSINNKGLKIVQGYELENKTEPYTPDSPRITLKDHKPDFNNKPTVRLINVCLYIFVCAVCSFIVTFSAVIVYMYISSLC